MSIRIKYFVHGITQANENMVAAGTNESHLSKRGIDLAKESSAETRLMDFDVIFCSDLHRTKQTAEIMFDLSKTKTIHDKRLRECDYGLLNGAAKSMVVYNDHIDKPFENGESLMDVEKRIRSLISDLKQKYDNKSIAIVSHRAPQLALEVCLNNSDWHSAIKNDWREKGKWQLGWDYTIPTT